MRHWLWITDCGLPQLRVYLYNYGFDTQCIFSEGVIIVG